MTHIVFLFWNANELHYCTREYAMNVSPYLDYMSRTQVTIAFFPIPNGELVWHNFAVLPSSFRVVCYFAFAAVLLSGILVRRLEEARHYLCIIHQYKIQAKSRDRRGWVHRPTKMVAPHDLTIVLRTRPVHSLLRLSA